MSNVFEQGKSRFITPFGGMLITLSSSPASHPHRLHGWHLSALATHPSRHHQCYLVQYLFSMLAIALSRLSPCCVDDQM